MTLEPGLTLLHYRIAEKIGEGGMGVVWKARDTRLNRDVAVKVLRDEVSSDAGRVARLQREARALASLQHSGIASIFGLEEDGPKRFLVMELVDGEDLAQRLQRGAVPAEEALDIARQMAEALEAAHERGIVHRDLKPANVKLTPDGRVKVLDFGLAKALLEETADRVGDSTQSPTLTAAATHAGVILGTAAYMSPEQARGRPVDRRADIWSFGCVLYEMLTGTRLFTGETVSDTLAAVLKTDPDWTLLPGDTGPRVEALLARCLRKDPRERLRDIGDARLELAEVLSGGPDGRPVPEAGLRRHLGWMRVSLGLLAGAIVTAAALRLFAPALPEPELRKFAIPIPDLGVGWERYPRLSPDGRHIAYLSRGRLRIRDLRRFEATEVPESDGATNPFWSPDSARLGFSKDGNLRTWALAGGPVTPICAIPDSGGLNGAAWGGDGRIYFAMFRGGLYVVAAAGGEPRIIDPLEPGEIDFHDPVLLPGGRHLITATHSKSGPHQVIAVSVGDGSRKVLGSFEGLGTVAYSPTGHLLLHFALGRQRILAASFSESRLEIVGEPFLVAPGGQFPSASANGSIAYTLGSSSIISELVWMDHDGRIGQVVGRPRLGLQEPAISPDGRKVAVVSHEAGNADIWIQDLERGTWSKLVSGPQDEYAPAWSSTGDRLFYLRQEPDFFGSVMEIEMGNTASPRAHAAGVEGPPIAISPDDRTVVYAVEEEGRNVLWSNSLVEESEPVRLTHDTSISEWHPAISPDGRWLAYVSDEPGSPEVFLRSFPGGGQKLQVSLDGGWAPFWSQRGDALYYWERGALITVPVLAGDSLQLGAARALFSAAATGLETPVWLSAILDEAADGRFLAVRRSSDDPHRGILLVENWFEEFRGR